MPALSLVHGLVLSVRAAWWNVEARLVDCWDQQSGAENTVDWTRHMCCDRAGSASQCFDPHFTFAECCGDGRGRALLAPPDLVQDEEVNTPSHHPCL